MELLRRQLLQAELDRIEAEAEANSYAIMNKADALAASHVLCQKINDGQQTEFHPTVIYYPIGLGCQIIIYTHDLGDVFLRRAKEIGLPYDYIVDPHIDGKSLFTQVRFTGFAGVDVDIKLVYLDMVKIREAEAA